MYKSNCGCGLSARTSGNHAVDLHNFFFRKSFTVSKVCVQFFKEVEIVRNNHREDMTEMASRSNDLVLYVARRSESKVSLNIH